MGVQSISVPQALAQALNTAGARSGVDFGYLLQTALRESSLNPAARAATSSAVGLFQFLEGTWLEVVKEHGPRLGYQRYADMIEKTRDGDYVVRDPQLRAQLLKLREDPQMAADMAAAFTRANGEYLAARFGRMPSAGELYIAHFLGAAGAERLFAAGLQNPEQSAARLFPRQAAANPTIFYTDGRPRSIREVYRVLVSRHEAPAQSAGFAVQQMASQPATQTAAPQKPEVVPSRFAAENVSFTGLFRTAPEPARLPPLAPPGGEAEGDAQAPLFTRLYAP